MVGFDDAGDGTGDMDPSQAAEYATGGPADGGGADASLGGLDTASGPLQRLFDGNAQGPSVQEIEDDYGLGKAVSIALRGVLRTATGSGVPPVAEILVGGVLWVRESNQAASDTAGELETGVGIDPEEP